MDFFRQFSFRQFRLSTDRNFWGVTQ